MIPSDPRAAGELARWCERVIVTEGSGEAGAPELAGLLLDCFPAGLDKSGAVLVYAPDSGQALEHLCEATARHSGEYGAGTALAWLKRCGFLTWAVERGAWRLCVEPENAPPIDPALFAWSAQLEVQAEVIDWAANAPAVEPDDSADAWKGDSE